MLHALLQVVITNEVPACNDSEGSPRHTRKGVLISRIIASRLCTAAGCQQFRKESRKLQTRIVLKRIIIHFSTVISCVVYT